MRNFERKTQNKTHVSFYFFLKPPASSYTAINDSVKALDDHTGSCNYTACVEGSVHSHATWSHLPLRPLICLWRKERKKLVSDEEKALFVPPIITSSPTGPPFPLANGASIAW